MYETHGSCPKCTGPVYRRGRNLFACRPCRLEFHAAEVFRVPDSRDPLQGALPLSPVVQGDFFAQVAG